MQAKIAKWYHKLYLWIFPTKIHLKWIEKELFKFHIKKVFGKYYIWKTIQLIYDVEKHINDIKLGTYPLSKLLKSLKIENKVNFNWDTKEINKEG